MCFSFIHLGVDWYTLVHGDMYNTYMYVCINIHCVFLALMIYNMYVYVCIFKGELMSLWKFACKTKIHIAILKSLRHIRCQENYTDLFVSVYVQGVRKILTDPFICIGFHCPIPRERILHALKILYACTVQCLHSETAVVRLFY